MPLALSRTQDDKGRVQWTLFGGSEQGPARGFWKSFYTSPGRERPPDEALAFVRRLLGTVYDEPAAKLTDLRAAGFRILPEEKPLLDFWGEGPLPAWTKPYILSSGEPVSDITYLLTFRPFGQLPPAVREAYLAGRLHLLPCPGSLVFWGPPGYLKLQHELPMATQIPLLHSLVRHEGPNGIRIPQSGWLHEPRPGQPEPGDFHGPLRNTYRRTHRWGRVHRDENELAIGGHEDKLMHVLFSTAGDDMGLYGKPMARNAQLWSHDLRLILDGPNATPDDIRKAVQLMHEGGLFGYRFQFPAMRVGRHEVYWHRPLVAYMSPALDRAIVLHNSPAGYCTAYRADKPNLARPVEMWPNVLKRTLHTAAIELFCHAQDLRPHLTVRNLRKLLDTHHLLGGKPLPYSLARQLLTLSKKETLEDWLHGLVARASDRERGCWFVEELRRLIASPVPPLHGIATRGASEGTAKGRKGGPASLTLEQTARRSFEVAYWKTIAFLAESKYLTKNNADCVRDMVSQAAVAHHHRDLEALGDYLLDYYTRAVKKARMTGKALVGDLPFTWRTDFNFSLFGGWLNNQEGHTHERDLILVIPGRDRKRAVIMSDHYDTAYMEDHFSKEHGGTGARVAAAGADDNYSATAAMMLAAPIFLKLSRQGKLACDIWLVHLTGEEFPADCLGARHLCQRLVEGTLKMRLRDGRLHDLSKTRVQGVYVADMIAHNN
ncbi:MAG: Zn-dependent exopeptidase M28, partial [Planctomycetota bacterium]